jgi:uncharacterized protein YjbJ (UPF0337 family)
MAGKTEVWKGRIEEAAGALLGNDKLREKGKKDQVAGEAKQAAAKVVGKAKQAARNVVSEAKAAGRKAVDEAKEVAQQSIDKATGVT